MERAFFTSQIRLNVISILLTRLMTVHNNITKPTPMKTPPLVCERYELTKERMASVVSIFPPKPLRNWCSIRLSNPKPRATANKMASIGTMASSVLYVSAEALLAIRSLVNRLIQR